MSPRFGVAVVTPVLFFLPAIGAHAQWVPSGALAAVPVVRDCTETGGDVAVSRLDPATVYLCQNVMNLVRKKNPGAEHFYFVHEFGHVAQATADEAAADCWAARELARAPNGSRYLNAAIEHFRQRPNEYSPRYGTPTGRAERIRACAEEERADVLAQDRPMLPRRAEMPQRRRADCVESASQPSPGPPCESTSKPLLR